MSLEAELQRCTAALEALTAILGKTAIFPIINTEPATAVDAPPKPAAVEAPPKPVATPPAAVIEPAKPEPAAQSLSKVEYAQVAKAITDVFKVDRAKVVEALAKFGAAKGPQLKPEDYAAFLQELQA